VSRPGADRILGERYRLIAEIARGGMAVVYHAQDTLLERLVAVKLLHPQFVGDPEFLERFRREARAAARLSHPNIVSIYDVGDDNGTPYIVMELVEGGNLKDRIRQSAPLPDAEIRSIGATLASTLDYAHRKGLIHRDVKPQNVLLGEDGRPRLTDFGIAQAMASSGLTRTGVVMGSVQYIAPELVRGRTALPQSDVYSLGVVLYEMATGRVPFQGETDLSVAVAHVEEIPAAPRALNARLAPDLEASILRALAKAPDLRFASAADFAQALRTPATDAPARPGTRPPAVVAGQTQRMPTHAVQARPSAGAQRRATTAVAASAVAPAPFSRHTARPKPKRGASNGIVGLLVALAAVLVALGAGFYGLATLSRGGILTPDPTAPPTLQPTAPAKPAAVPTNTAAPSPQPTSTPQPRPSDTPAPSTPTLGPATPTPPPPTPTPPAPSPTARLVAVPQLRGKPLDQAQSALAQAGLTVTVRGANSNVDKNIVFDQSPDAGATIAPGGAVTLQVGTGSTAIPDVANQPRDQAVRTLLNSSFHAVLRDRHDPRIPAGSAIGTTPPAGTIEPRGAEIELDISAGR
jgi:serine/threonine-protein kinase